MWPAVSKTEYIPRGEMKSTILSAGVAFAVFAMISCALTDDSPMAGTQAEPCIAKGSAMNNASLPQDAHLVRDETHQTIVFLRGRDLSGQLSRDPEFRRLQSEGRALDLAMAFVCHYRKAFQLKAPEQELVKASVAADDLGLVHVRFDQAYRGITVEGAQIIVHLDREKRVYLVNGRYIPTPETVDTDPGIKPSDLPALLMEEKKLADIDGHLLSELLSASSEDAALVIFSGTVSATLPGEKTEPRLAYRVTLSVRPDQGWTWFVDAHTGEILETRTLVRSGGVL